MELTMASQVDATPWTATTIPQKEASPIAMTPESTAPLLGRAYFSQLGIVRRKPSRGDAPPTRSKSCSDKLSLRQCISLLSSLTSLVVSPDHAYISTLILPKSQYNASGCRRAFSDGQSQGDDDKEAGSQQARMAPLRNLSRGWGGGYRFQPFRVKTTDFEFAFSRQSTTISPLPSLLPFHSLSHSSPSSIATLSPTDPSSGLKPKSRTATSNLSTALTASGREETTLNGVLHGRKAADADIRGASFASRRRMWSLAVEVASSLTEDKLKASQTQDVQQAFGATASSASTSSSSVMASNTPTATRAEAESETECRKTYADVKNTPLLEPRWHAKEAARRLALKGWLRNTGDEGFAL